MPVADVAWDVFVAHHITTSRMLGVTSTQILRTLDGIDQAFWVETSIVDDASEDTCPASAQQSAPQLGWSSTALSLRSTSSRLHSNDLPIAAPWRVALSSNLTMPPTTDATRPPLEHLPRTSAVCHSSEALSSTKVHPTVRLPTQTLITANSIGATSRLAVPNSSEPTLGPSKDPNAALESAQSCSMTQTTASCPARELRQSRKGLLRTSAPPSSSAAPASSISAVAPEPLPMGPNKQIAGIETVEV